jgi:MFS family permease
LFVLWSGASVALQIPAGALADRISRRLLLGVGCALRAVGFALWVVVPGYPGFAAGFVLWAVKGALTSGTLESLVYDELAAVGRTDRYTGLTGRASAALGAAELVATVAAGPVLATGGYRLVGYASVAVCVVQTLVALSFRDAPRLVSDDEDPGYLATLRAGVAEVVRRPQLRSLVLIAGLGGLLAIDEYLPLLARDAGLTASDIPLLLLVPALARIVS